ncbi:MAG: SpoIID/LytB domain-containing protein [Nitrospirota bacterium]|nr:SpoIID/LytB domain-containing protein [Nitrospirota bacterium]
MRVRYDRCLGFLLVSWITICSPVVWATEPAIRVGLANAAQVLSIQSADSFSIRLPSGKTFNASGQVTVRVQGAGLLLNDRTVVEPHVWVEGSPGTYQVRVWMEAGKVDLRDASQEWVVRGPLEIQSSASGLGLINWIDLEAYVAGVVSGEVGAKWPIEALKAQAVAARTYVLYKKVESQLQPFDVVAGVQDQVYHGHSVRAESVLEAVASTRGQVVTFDNRPIFAAYSSTAAGPTEDALFVWALDLPYLKGVDCPFDEQAPRYDWRTSFTFDYLEQQLRKEGYSVGKVATLTPYTFTPSGRVDRVRLLHSRGEIILRGQDLRRVVGYSKIFSTQFSIESFGPEVVVVGHGAGHAVGMCQWGMREMAELGYDYQSIVRHYYPGTTLLPIERVILTAAD